MKRKCVLNKQHGGFRLSKEAIRFMLNHYYPDAVNDLFKKTGTETFDPSRYECDLGGRYSEVYCTDRRYPEHIIDKTTGQTYVFQGQDAELRFHPALVGTVEALESEAASAEHSQLEVVTVEIEFDIESLDGKEKKVTVSAVHFSR